MTIIINQSNSQKEAAPIKHEFEHLYSENVNLKQKVENLLNQNEILELQRNAERMKVETLEKALHKATSDCLVSMNEM